MVTVNFFPENPAVRLQSIILALRRRRFLCRPIFCRIPGYRAGRVHNEFDVNSALQNLCAIRLTGFTQV